MKEKSRITSPLIIFACIIIILAFSIYHYEIKVFEYKQSYPPSLALVDPEEAPETIRKDVMHGFMILVETPKYAPKYTGDKMSCNNCHFDGGNSFGGKNNGIPLVGVAYKYPHFSSRENKRIDLAERIANCFERSMNGSFMPANTPEMKSLLAYFNWISTPVKEEKKMSWLGLPPLRLKYIGSKAAGEKLYAEHCAICHGKEGRGVKTEEGNNIPPLWGPEAFNDGAGMSRRNVFASFIYWNMPLGQPILTEKEAIDIAAFVTSQERPKFKDEK